MISIHHHLGLGDHIICNGLVREIYKKHPSIKLFCKKENAESVSFMYKDLPFLKISEVSSDEDVSKEDFILKIGFDISFLYINFTNYTWDESFYKQCNIDFSKRWTSFYFERDPLREKEFFKKLNPQNEPFALIHSSGSDKIERVDETKINKNLKQIKIKKEYSNNIFDYSSLIDQAEEIHCIDSAFKHLVDSFSLSKNLFYHDKNNKRSKYNHISKNEWRLV
jgi:hypothetical protein